MAFSSSLMVRSCDPHESSFMGVQRAAASVLLGVRDEGKRGVGGDGGGMGGVCY